MKNRQRANPQQQRRLTSLEKLRRIDRSGPIDAADSFVMRVVKGLGVSFEQLAEICEISYDDCLELVASSRSDLSRFDTDPLWNRLQDYVLLHLGHVMAVNAELNIKMQEDRKRRMAQRLREQTHL